MANMAKRIHDVTRKLNLELSPFFNVSARGRAVS
jgi:hypothetical protein